MEKLLPNLEREDQHFRKSGRAYSPCYTLAYSMAELVASSGGHDLDKWIERLYDCKPLSEAEVKSLCEQV